MQMRFLSLSVCSSPDSRHTARGFTLIELLVSIAIIGIVTSIVLVRYTAFDSSTLLKNAAYDIALALREAQIKSISVLQGTEGFNYPYGISITPGTMSYTAFRFLGTGDPQNNGSAEEIGVLPLPGRTIQIKDVCVSVPGERCDIARLDVAFRRPEFSALFWAGSGISTSTITSAKIIVASTENPNEEFWVTITRLGQVSVCKQGTPNCI